jgi:hypothetical protein
MNNGGVNSLHLLIDPSVSVDVMKSAIDFLDDLSKSTRKYDGCDWPTLL